METSASLPAVGTPPALASGWNGVNGYSIAVLIFVLLVSSGAGGHEVPQMLVNFQMKNNGGEGWLRLLEIQPDGRTIKAVDDSPTLDQQNTSSDNRFEFQIPPPSGQR